ncbi:MAG: hypothetical protein JXA18_03425 [Chitinispirillaceae bacterium]|nr:hypothetical protein [Chitinispirillaceae bacterium]
MKTAVTAYMMLCFAISSTCAQEKLFVFYPTTTRPQTVQERLEENANDVSVTVFGRYVDMSEKIVNEPPDALLSKPALIRQLGNYTIALNGIRKGTAKETYVLMSINTPIDPKTVGAQTVIGAIDVLGRTGMKSFIGRFFPVEPKLKRVTKIEDLLPLLTFNMADAVLIEAVFIQYFKSTSHLEFTVTSLSETDSGIIALAIKNNGKAENTLTAFKKAGKGINTLFEVDQWK